MMTCKDCFHYDMCDWLSYRSINYVADKGGCSYFKDKSKIIELPMKCTPELKMAIEEMAFNMCVDEL